MKAFLFLIVISLMEPIFLNTLSSDGIFLGVGIGYPVGYPVGYTELSDGNKVGLHSKCLSFIFSKLLN